MMKTTANHPFVLRTRIMKEKQERQPFLWDMLQYIDGFFGLETKSDRMWFYGFYGTACFLVVFLLIVSNLFDFFIMQ
ncbi:DUF3961 domain-containing protein [Microbacteriaceae bacterium 4G12]